MDEALPINVQNKIEKTIMNVDGVKGIKILKTRSAGMKKHIESRIIVSNRISAKEACGIANTVEHVVANLFDNANVIIKPEIEEK